MTPRKHERRSKRLPVTFGGRLEATTQDLSDAGLCAEMDGVFLPGSEVEGTVRVGRKARPFAGVVAWAIPGRASGKPSRVGVRFT